MANISDPESHRRVRAPLLVFIILAIGSALAAAWWYRPANAENRYSRMSLVSLRQLLDRDTNNAKAWRQLGLRVARDGDAALAEPALVQALQLNPADSQLSAALGEIWMAGNRYPEAFQILKAAELAHPKDPVAHRALGRLYLRKASYQHAYDEFEAVVTADRLADDAWFQMAVCSVEMQKASQAQEDVGRAVALKPNDAHYLALQGSVNIAAGNAAEGIKQMERAAELAPKDIKIESSLINLLLEQHRDAADLAAAEAAIGRLEQLSPDYPLIPLMRGKLELLKQNWDAAARYLEKAMRANPQQDQVYFDLSQAYRRLNRAAESDKMITLYRRRLETRKRIDALTMAVSATPADISLYRQLVDLKMQLGDQDSAVETIKAGLQIEPHNEVLLKWLRALAPNASEPQ